MTVSAGYAPSIYSADGNNRYWVIPFEWVNDSEVNVQIILSDGTISDVSSNYAVDRDNSRVIYPTVTSGLSPLSLGNRVIVYRKTERAQEFDATVNPFALTDLNNSLDNIVKAIQEIDYAPSDATIVFDYSQASYHLITDIGCVSGQDCVPQLNNWLSSHPNNLSIYIPSGEFKFSTDFTFPTNVKTLVFDPSGGAYLSPNTGKAVTFTGQYISVGVNNQLFTGLGTLLGSFSNHCVYPEWWGAVGDATTDCSSAFQKAIDFSVINSFGLLAMRGARVQLGPRRYMCNNVIVRARSYIQGITTKTMLCPITDNPIFVYDKVADHSALVDLYFYSNNPTFTNDIGIRAYLYEGTTNQNPATKTGCLLRNLMFAGLTHSMFFEFGNYAGEMQFGIFDRIHSFNSKGDGIKISGNIQQCVFTGVWSDQAATGNALTCLAYIEDGTNTIFCCWDNLFLHCCFEHALMGSGVYLEGMRNVFMQTFINRNGLGTTGVSAFVINPPGYSATYANNTITQSRFAENYIDIDILRGKGNEITHNSFAYGGTPNPKACAIRIASGVTGNIVRNNLTEGYPHAGWTTVNDFSDQGTDVLITAGTGAPTTIPSFKGEQYIDSTTRKIYTAINNTESQDWICVNNDFVNTRFRLTNLLLTDGNFGVDTDEDGLTDNWIDVKSGSFSIASNVQSFTQNDTPAGIIRHAVTPVNGHIYYACAFINGAYNQVFIDLNVGGFPYTVSSPLTTFGSFVFKSVMCTAISNDTGSMYVFDQKASDWSEVQVKLAHVFDLTATFGAGNEPAKSDIDDYMSSYASYIENKNITYTIPVETRYRLMNLLQTIGNFDVDSNQDGLTDEWISVGSTGFSISSNIQSFTANEAPSALIRHVVTPINDHIYYACAFLNAAYNEVFIRLTVGGFPNVTSSALTVFNEFVFKSIICTATSDVAGSFYIFDQKASDWSEVQAKQVHIYDLTAIFGTGNEPTQEQMDTYMSAIVTYIDEKTVTFIDSVIEDAASIFVD